MEKVQEWNAIGCNSPSGVVMERTVVSVVRGISLNYNLIVQNPKGKDQSCGKSLFKCFKGRMALIGKVPGCTLAGEACKWNGDFRISVNETTVEIGKTKERLDILDIPGFRPVLDNLDLYRAMVRPSGDSIYPRYLQEVA